MRLQRGVGRIIKIGFVLLILALIGTAFFLFNQKSETPSALGTPKLPILYAKADEVTINAMRGYTTAQDLKTQRDTLLPLDANHIISLEADPNGNTIESIGYEITSLADGSFVENGNARKLSQKDGKYTAEIELTAPMLMGQEYGIRFRVSCKSEEGETDTVYYYSRLLQQTGTNLSKYLSFANEFYQNCLDKEKSNLISTRMESDNSGNSGAGFAHVTINSGINLVTWGNLKPELQQKAVPKVKELNTETASIEMEYILHAVNAKKQDEYFVVKDFYRLRTNQGQVVLVDLDRRTEQIFDPKTSTFNGRSVDLGVRNESVVYSVSPKGKRAAFVSEGELWMLGTKSGDSAVQVFSFRGESKPTLMTVGEAHQIRICNLDDEGNMTFVVTGYMSAGLHEGMSGVSVYEYSASKNRLEEKLFIASEKNYEYLNYFLSKVGYANEQNRFYLYTGKQLLRTELKSGKYEEIVGDVKDECIAASSDQKYVAWMDEMDPNASKNIQILDTETGQIRTMTAPDGEKLRLLGYFNQDLIYGSARDADIITDSAGNTAFGMYKITIAGADGAIKKEYEQQDTYITRVTRSETGNLELELSARTENGYKISGTDQIIDNVKTGGSTLQFVSESDQRTRTRLWMPFAAASSSGKHILVSGMKEISDRLNLKMPEDEKSFDSYAVYANGGLFSLQSNVNEALRRGDAERGVVLNPDQSYLYERGNWRTSIRIDRKGIPQQLWSPTFDMKQISDALGEGYEILNYTGCSTMGIRYQLSRNYPVIAKFDDSKAVLLLGYDIFDNLWYYDPDTKKEKAIGKNDSAARFAEYGNVFISWRKK